MAASTVNATVTELPESRVRVEAEVPARRGREAPRAGRARPRPQHPRARLPRRQGAAAGRDPARRPPGRARRGGPRVDRRLVRRRHRRAPTSPRSASPTSTSPSCPARASRCASRSRSASARRRRSASTRASRSAAASPTSPTRRSAPRSTRSASARPSSRPSTAPPSAATSWSWTSSARSTARRSAAARGATRWSSSAPAASCPASRSSSRAPAPGEERTVKVDFPEDYGAAELAGKQAEFAVTVKEIKAKDLPALDDELAAEAGFDTLDELRDDIRTRIGEQESSRIEAEFREAALDSAVGGRHRRGARLAGRGPRARAVGPDAPLALAPGDLQGDLPAISGREEDEIVEAGKEDAAQALRREAVLAAIIEAEGIEPTEEDLLEAVGEAARGRLAQEAAGAAEVRGADRRPQGGPRAAPRARPRGRVGEADQRRAGAGERQAVDPREGGRNGLFAGGDLDARLVDVRTGSGDGWPLLQSGEPVKDSSARSETKRGL